MLFNIMCFLLIVLITLYLATQGLLSALLALVTATFSSILAMALTEPLQGLLAGYMPDKARGVTFLILFLVTFGITRVVADLLVPANIKLPFLVNRIAGGAVGFFAAMVVMGTTINGIEMLPLGTTMMGYERFPGDSRMQGEVAGVAAAPSNTWLQPERVTLAIWNGASGRGLGGGKPFASVHPDLNVESYGYRNTVHFASNHVLPKDLFTVNTGWESGDPKTFEPFGIKLTEAGKKIVMVRTTVQRGKTGHTSSDADDTYFRVTPSEVRLVTDKGHQYYPIGFLDKGQLFEPLSLDSGHLVDDYARGGSVVEEWVFQVNDDEKAQFIEVKQLARADLSGVIKNSPVGALAANNYPQKAYQKEASTLEVVLTAPDPISEGKVYLIRSGITRNDAFSQIDVAYRKTLDITKEIGDATGSWTSAGKPGVPGQTFFSQAQRTGLNLQGMGINDNIETEKALQVIMVTPFTADGPRNLAEVPHFITDTIIPLVNKFSGARGLIKEVTVPVSGKLTITEIPKGTHTILATLKTDKGFYYWIRNQPFEPRSSKSITFDAKDATFGIVP